MKKIYFIILFAFAGVIANAQYIYTIAGGIGNGYSGDGGQAIAAQLSSMQGAVTKDAAGNVYIPDMNNNRIRKVDAVTGVITTIAGTGAVGYNGDGIPATSAELSEPSVVAVDVAGNIYIGEYGGCRIRKINASTGLISTLIGNGTSGYNGDNIAANTAITTYITGIALDAAGNIYFSDMGNQIIRKITVSSGIVNTIAGTAGASGFSGDGGSATSAKLNIPTAIALDNNNNVFIADMQNNRIRKVVNSNGQIFTVAGTNISGYNGDGISANTAQLNAPWGVASDASGNFYIADRYNYRVRKVNVSGIISTIAGNGVGAVTGDGGPSDSSEVNNPFGVYVDVCGAVYITEYGGNAGVRKISPYNISIISTNAKCHGACNGTVNASASGGAGAYTYSWSGGIGIGPNHTSVCQGTYIVTATDANGCKSNASATISQPTAISLTVHQTKSATCLNDGSASSSVSGGTAPYTYSWSSGSLTSTASGLSAGNYSLTLTDTNNCVSTQTVTIVPNTINVAFTNTNANCNSNGSTNASVSGGTAPYSYSWSNGSLTSTASGLSAGNYSLTVTDSNGCFTIQVDVIVNDSVIFASVPICMVTVDSASQHNIIVWDKTSFTNADSFIVYREIASNNYQRINAQPYSNLSQFVDTVRTLYFPNTGNPNAGTYRYKIQTLDTCGSYSTLSPYHNTIYILNSSGTFYWTQPYTIQGGANPVSSYVLMRDNLSNGSWQQVSSVAGTQQTVSDPLYTIYQSTASWRVQTNWNITCVPTLRVQNSTASNFSSSYSNIYTNNPNAIKNNSLDEKLNVSPNPSDGKISLEYSSLEKNQKASVEVYNMIGTKVFYKDLTLNPSPTGEGHEAIDLSPLPSGVYFLNLKTENNTIVKKIIIQ